MYTTSIGVAWWRSGYGVGLVIERSRVRLPAVSLSGNDSVQAIHTTHEPVTKQYNLLLARRR